MRAARGDVSTSMLNSDGGFLPPTTVKEISPGNSDGGVAGAGWAAMVGGMTDSPAEAFGGVDKWLGAA